MRPMRLSRNRNRLGKNLWTKVKPANKLLLYAAFNERDEAHYMVATIRQWVRQVIHIKISRFYIVQMHNRVF